MNYAELLERVSIIHAEEIEAKVRRKVVDADKCMALDDNPSLLDYTAQSFVGPNLANNYGRQVHEDHSTVGA